MSSNQSSSTPKMPSKPKPPKPKTFTCDRCDKKLTSRSHLSRHMDTHSDVMKYKCELCGWQFRQAYNLQRHKRAHTVGEGSLVMNCEFCNAIFSNKSVLAVHVKKDHGKKGKPRIMQEPKAKVKHEPKSPKDHDKEKDPLNVKEEPKELGIWYPNPKKDVLKEPNPEQQEFPVCEICDIRFINEESLEFHISKHSESNSLNDSVEGAEKNNNNLNKEEQLQEMKRKFEEAQIKKELENGDQEIGYQDGAEINKDETENNNTAKVIKIIKTPIEIAIENNNLPKRIKITKSPIKDEFWDSGTEEENEEQPEDEEPTRLSVYPAEKRFECENCEEKFFWKKDHTGHISECQERARKVARKFIS